MKILFDSSILIAGMVESHHKHEFALAWLQKVGTKKFDAIVSAHSLLEIYSVLTSAPFKPKISPELAYKLVEVNIKKKFKTVQLTASEYFVLIHQLSAEGFKGGIVYDALIYACAKKIKVEKLLTLNSKDFLSLNTGDLIEIISI